VENNSLSDGFDLPKGMMYNCQLVQSYAQYAEDSNLSPEQV
jgi:filamentous hemagglutinin